MTPLLSIPQIQTDRLLVAQLGATLGGVLIRTVTRSRSSQQERLTSRTYQAGGSRDSLPTRGSQQTRYFFKYALIQDTAYQSLLKRTRQQLHQQIAQVLEERFPETKVTPPKLLTHHYIEANLVEQRN
jgi:predicted ATPase